MIAVLTPGEMGEVDRAAAEPVEVLIERAGLGVARAARRMLGGAYGRRVTVIAGQGNNGADGRAAARFLEGWGARVVIVDAGTATGSADADLLVDAAYGTGLSRAYHPPDPGQSLVVSVDIPSGLSGVTGRPVGDGGAVRATCTVTFASYKPGLLIGDGPDCAGEVEVVDIGLGPLVESAASAWLVTDDDVRRMWPARPRRSHKWQSAVQIVAGSAPMPGAAWLVGRGALRAGAGYALIGVPGAPPGGGLPPGEQVARTIPAHDWDGAVAGGLDRVKALVIGPGLGPAGGPGKDSEVARLLVAAPDVPAVVDADGINALADLDTVTTVVRAREAATVLTPHDGEYARLSGRPPAEDRIGAVRSVAAQTGAFVLLKGPATIVASPDGQVRIVNAGSPRLATAGTGDVLSGVIGAFLARGLPALEAASLAAHAHGRAAALGPTEGLIASDLPDLLSQWLSAVNE